MWQLDKDHQRLFPSKKLNGRPKNGEINTRNKEGDNTKNTGKSFKIYKIIIHNFIPINYNIFIKQMII